jgi:IclR family acetate operon transcriptional repressor
MVTTGLPLSGSTAKPSYLSRLLDVLELAVTDDAARRSLSQLAATAGVPLSTASRLVSLLVDRGLLHALPGGGFGAGPRMMHLAVRALAQLRDGDRLESAVRSLAEQTGESVSAGLLVGDGIVLVARQEPDHALRAVARVGDIVTAHTSAMGKAILAHLPAERQLALIRRELGEGAEDALAQLHEEVQTIRAEGFSVDEETYTPGLRCRAAALLGRDGVAVGGLSIAGPAARYTQEKATADLPALRAEADRVSLVVRSHQ